MCEVIEDDHKEPFYNEVKKEDYISKLKENSSYLNSSSCFLNESFLFIAYLKSSKGYIIQTNAIK